MRVLIVGHDASRTGAPMVLRHLAEWLRTDGVEIAWLLAAGGPLVGDYRQFGECLVLGERPGRVWFPGRASLMFPSWLYRQMRNESRVRSLVQRFRPDVIYVNSLASWPAARFLKSLPVPWLVHVHELQDVIEGYCGVDEAESLLSRANIVLACSGAVEENLSGVHRIEPDRLRLLHEFIRTDRFTEIDESESRRTLRRQIGASPEALVVGGLGLGGLRKGTDLFVQLAIQTLRQSSREVHFAWVGQPGCDPTAIQVQRDIERAGISRRMHFLGEQKDPRGFLVGIDLFALMSREDPYPLAALEAAAAGKPVFCFAEAGGMPEFVSQGCGQVIPYLDVGEFARAVVSAVEQPELRQVWGATALSVVRANHDVDVAGRRLREMLHELAAARRETVSV